MNRKSKVKSTFFTVLAVIGVILFIEWIIDASETKCAISGCNNNAVKGSSYCYLHKPYSSNSLYKSNSSKNTNTTKCTTLCSKPNSGSTSSDTKKNNSSYN